MKNSNTLPSIKFSLSPQLLPKLILPILIACGLTGSAQAAISAQAPLFCHPSTVKAEISNAPLYSMVLSAATGGPRKGVLIKTLNNNNALIAYSDDACRLENSGMICSIGAVSIKLEASVSVSPQLPAQFKYSWPIDSTNHAGACSHSQDADRIISQWETAHHFYGTK